MIVFEFFGGVKPVISVFITNVSVTEINVVIVSLIVRIQVSVIFIVATFDVSIHSSTTNALKGLHGWETREKGIGFQPEISFPFGCDDQITSATTSRHYNSFLKALITIFI